MAEQKLHDDIEATSRYFTSMLELVPAKFYIEDSENASKYQFQKKRKMGTLDKKLLAKKAKLLKLDPSTHKTIEEWQCEIEKKEAELFEEESNNVTRIKPIKISDCPSASIEELRARLHSKMTQLRGKRKILEGQEKKDVRKARLDRKELKSQLKKKQKLSENIKRATDVESASAKSVVNDEGEVVFSKFDFATDSDIVKHKKKKKKDLNKLLAVAEKNVSKINLLKEQDLQAAQQAMSEHQWVNAVKRAQGEKVKDDPKLLKKALKRKEKQKEHSKKQWENRMNVVEKQKADKQRKRKENIAEKKAHKLSKKLGVSKKGSAQNKMAFTRTHKPGF